MKTILDINYQFRTTVRFTSKEAYGRFIEVDLFTTSKEEFKRSLNKLEEALPFYIGKILYDEIDHASVQTRRNDTRIIQDIVDILNK